MGLHAIPHVGRGWLIIVVPVARWHAQLRRVIPATGIAHLRIPRIRNQNSPAEVDGGGGSLQAHVKHFTRPRLALVKYFGDHLPQRVAQALLYPLTVLAQLVDRVDKHADRLLHQVQRVFRHHISEHLRGPHQVSCKRQMCNIGIIIIISF